MNIRNLLQITSLLALLLVATTSFAQSGGSTVRGTVKDPNGNLVSGANVTLTNPEKNFTRTQTTNEDGAPDCTPERRFAGSTSPYSLVFTAPSAWAI